MITASVPPKHPWDRIAPHVERGFLRLLERKLILARVEDSRLLVARVTDAAAQLVVDNAATVDDRPTQTHLLMASYVLASVNVLSGSMSQHETLRIIKQCVRENGALWAKWSFSIGLWLARNKFRYVVRNCGFGVKQSFGAGFAIDIETDHQTYLNTIVHRCPFHQWFSKYGMPQLTQMMCEWDNNWADSLQDHRYIRFERPSTIAEGHERCEFQYRTRARQGRGRGP